jgi:hypothetical protein
MGKKEERRRNGHGNSNTPQKWLKELNLSFGFSYMHLGDPLRND